MLWAILDDYIERDSFSSTFFLDQSYPLTLCYSSYHCQCFVHPNHPKASLGSRISILMKTEVDQKDRAFYLDKCCACFQSQDQHQGLVKFYRLLITKDGWLATLRHHFNFEISNNPILNFLEYSTCWFHQLNFKCYSYYDYAYLYCF